MQLYIPRRKTSHRALQWIFLRLCPLNRPRYQTDTNGYNIACATLERITAPVRHTPIPDTSDTPDAVQVSTACYYKRYIRVCPLLWVHARQCSISKTMPARLNQLLSSVDRWQVLHPAHLLTGQRLRLYRVSPAAVSMLPTPGGLRSGNGQQSGRTWSTLHTPSGWAVQRQGRLAARNHWRLSP